MVKNVLESLIGTFKNFEIKYLNINVQLRKNRLNINFFRNCYPTESKGLS